MAVSLLDHFLLSQLFAFLLIFVRLGSAMMVVPGIGDAYVPVRVRLLFSLSLAVLLVPLLGDTLPKIPSNPIALTIMLFGEITIGVAIGLLIRIMLSAMHVAGTIIASQSSLSIASMFDLLNGGQSTVVSNFLVLMTLVIFFQLNLHHVLLQGLVASYTLFPAGEIPSMGDFSELTSRSASDAFMMGVQLSAPHLVFGLIFYLGGGIMSRLMPQMQVFYVLMSAQIMVAFFLLIVIISSMMYIYMDHIHDAMNNLFQLE